MFIIGSSIDSPLLAASPRLRFVQKLGAGTDRIDKQACERHGVTVARLQAGNAVPVAEHTVMLMLAALRRRPYFDRRTREGQWLKEEGRGIQRQLAGKRVGLVGFGASKADKVDGRVQNAIGGLKDTNKDALKDTWASRRLVD